MVRKLVPIAADLGCTLAQMSLAWCLANPRVTSVITGASRPAQVVENMKALDAVKKLTPDVMARIDAILAAERPAA
jgi:aryl-alcohol dehydrogenase-like predicted oxidoreductase